MRHFHARHAVHQPRRFVLDPFHEVLDDDHVVFTNVRHDGLEYDYVLVCRDPGYLAVVEDKGFPALVTRAPNEGSWGLADGTTAKSPIPQAYRQSNRLRKWLRNVLCPEFYPGLGRNERHELSVFAGIVTPQFTSDSIIHRSGFVRIYRTPAKAAHDLAALYPHHPLPTLAPSEFEDLLAYLADAFEAGEVTVHQMESDDPANRARDDGMPDVVDQVEALVAAVQELRTTVLDLVESSAGPVPVDLSRDAGDAPQPPGASDLRAAITEHGRGVRTAITGGVLAARWDEALRELVRRVVDDPVTRPAVADGLDVAQFASRLPWILPDGFSADATGHDSFVTALSAVLPEGAVITSIGDGRHLLQLVEERQRSA